MICAVSPRGSSLQRAIIGLLTLTLVLNWAKNPVLTLGFLLRYRAGNGRERSRRSGMVAFILLGIFRSFQWVFSAGDAVCKRVWWRPE